MLAASMDTILFFTIRTARGGAQKQFVSAQTTAKGLGLLLQMVECAPTVQVVRELTGLWHPLGAIVDCGGPWGELDPGVFGALPVVMLGANPETLPPGTLSVRHDSAGTGRTAARELLATGYRHFAYVSPFQQRYWSETRQRAFVETIRLHGFECRVMKSTVTGPSDPAWQRPVRAFLRSLPKPCALFAASDSLGEGVLAAARYCGIAVPGELAVLGVDNNEAMCERAEPTLSSIEPDFHRAGRLAVEALVNAPRRGGGAAAPLDAPLGAQASSLRVCRGQDAHAPSFRGQDARATSGCHEWIYGDVRIVRRESTRPLASHDAIAAKALALIRCEACSGLRPAKVAALFPCSRRMADLRFRKAVGHSIGEEIHAVQLGEAKRLAADPSRQLKAIADFCGFGSPGSLRNFFRRETGMSLTAWRRANVPRTESPTRNPPA